MRVRVIWILVLACTWWMMSPAAALAEGPTMNGLSSRAFRANALTTNEHALKLLLRYALDDRNLYSMEGGYVALQLQDPHARAVMTEIVRCALGPAARVTDEHQVWRGELGLCQPDARMEVGDDRPSWGPSGPNVACQQLVTACVMARVNALELSVPLALRSEPAGQFPPDGPVPAGVTFRESMQDSDPSEGITIRSFDSSPCNGDNECNWAPAYVGWCDPASGTVQLTSKDTKVCDVTPVRVCAGIHGCLSPSSGHAPPVGYDERHYGAWWKDQSSACSIDFLCPAEVGGFYSMMTRPLGSKNGSPSLVKLAGSGRYPATTDEVFPFREGAFYGNLFVPTELAWNCEMTRDGTQRRCVPVLLPPGGPMGAILCDVRPPPVGGSTKPCEQVPTVPYRNVYACYSLSQRQNAQSGIGDNEGVAYLNGRICAGDKSGTCFPHPPKRCYYANDDEHNEGSAHCQWRDGGYRSCRGQSSVEYLTITTYLNGPCDLIDDVALCTAIQHGRRAAVAPAAPSGPAVASGCTTGAGTSSGLLVALVAALLARTRRRSRAFARSAAPRRLAPR